MGRPLSGYKKLNNGAWLVSVPRRRGSTERVYATFDLDAEAKADRWLAEQVERLNAGEDAQGSPKKPRTSRATRARTEVATGPSGSSSSAPTPRTFEEYALAWHHEYYDLLHRAGPERARDVMSDLRLHILPTFGGPLETDVARGRAAIIAWVRKMAGYPAQPGEAVDEDAPTYAKDNVSGMLWVISEVLLYAHTLGAPVVVVARKGGDKPAITNGVTAMAPRNRPKRKARLVSFQEARSLAGELNVIHQLALWLMRVAGLRIGEAYGLLVSNFVFDGEWGYLLIEAMGGRAYLSRDENEQVVTTGRKVSLKTHAGYRIIALPHAMTKLIRHAIDVFATDPETGEIDGSKRLISAIRSEEGGAAGFRSALGAAGRRLGNAVDEEDLVIPHDMRKGYATDLAWTPGVESILKRRAMGHRGGQDVYDLVYTLDDRLLEAMKPAALAIDAEIASSIQSLIVPTTVSPRYGSTVDASERALRAASLAEVGWQVSTMGEGWIGADEAAAILSMAVTATRRLFPAQIPAVKQDGQWRVRLEDVVAYRDRFEGWVRIEDLAEKVGATYHQVYATVRRLALEVSTDEYTRQVLLTPEQAEEVESEFSRIAELRRRSVTVAEAARTLNASHSSIGLWIKNGRLTADEETDSSGKTFVTRASVQSELDRRGMKLREVISAAELKEWSGLSDKDTRALVAIGVLQRGPRGGYTTESVDRWIKGYRPDLLDSGLIRYQ